MRVFSTRASEKEAVSKHFAKIVADQSLPVVTLTAKDKESSTGSSIWLPASKQNSNYIDSNSITSKKILLYKGSFFRFTANLSNIQARQGQLCAVLNLPEESSNVLEVWMHHRDAVI